MEPLPGIANLRDAGAVASGSLGTGVLLRSGHLSGLGSEAQAGLVDLGVTRVFDLRTADESGRRPDTLPAGISLSVVDVLADRPHSGAAAVASLINDHPDRAAIDDINDAVGGGRARDLMIETYRHLVSLPSAHTGYRAVLEGIASSPGASLVHCTAGKDRSGWAIALAQHLAGVRWEDILEDYLLSNAAMAEAYGPMLDAFAAEGGDAESLSHMIYVRPEYLNSAVTLVDHVFGGVDGYLTTAVGLREDGIRTLRRRLAP